MTGFNFSVRNGKRWSPCAVVTLSFSFSVRTPLRRVRYGGNTDSKAEAARVRHAAPGFLAVFPGGSVSSGSRRPCPTECVFSFKSFRAISTARLNVSPRLHLRPIDVVVCDGPLARSNLGVGFVLRCFQHLSCPDAATRLCHWRDNRYTGGLSSTVLSY